MSNYCENCGCKQYSGACTNCHEEIYIMDQYIELDMEIPKLILDKVEEHLKQIKDNK